jgi:hypothetical protein
VLSKSFDMSDVRDMEPYMHQKLKFKEFDKDFIVGYFVNDQILTIKDNISEISEHLNKNLGVIKEKEAQIAKLQGEIDQIVANHGQPARISRIIDTLAKFYDAQLQEVQARRTQSELLGVLKDEFSLN